MFEMGRPRSRGWKNIGRRWTKGMVGLENWTILMDVIFVSSLTYSKILYVKDLLSGLRRFLAAESPLKMLKNYFYFMLKALFVLKIFNFLY